MLGLKTTLMALLRSGGGFLGSLTSTAITDESTNALTDESGNALLDSGA